MTWKEQVIVEMIEAFDALSYSPTARIDAPLWARRFKRKARLLGIKIPKAKKP